MLRVGEWRQTLVLDEQEDTYTSVGCRLSAGRRRHHQVVLTLTPDNYEMGSPQTAGQDQYHRRSRDTDGVCDVDSLHCTMTTLTILTTQCHWSVQLVVYPPTRTNVTSRHKTSVKVKVNVNVDLFSASS